MKRLAIGYLGLVSVLLSTGQTSADPYGVIGINFTGRASGSGTPAYLHVEYGESSLGVAGVNGNDIWNDLVVYGDSGMRETYGPWHVHGSMDELANVLVSSRGTFSMTMGGNRVVPLEDPSGDLMDGEIHGDLDSHLYRVTVTDLADDFPAYDIYAYVGGSPGRYSELTLNGSTTVPFFSNRLFDGTFVEATPGNAGDYVVFRDVTGDSFTLAGGGTPGSTTLKGLEIVGVPHPDTQTVDLLSLVDLDRDVVEGSWEMVNNELVFEGSAARISFPYHPPAEYDYTVEYTLEHGSNPWDNFAQMASHGDVPFTWSTNAGTGHYSRLEDIDGHSVIGNPTLTPFEFVAGERYTSTVRVRNDRVIAEINGQTLVDYPTDYSDLSRNGKWTMPDQLNLGIGGYGGSTTIHSATVSFIPPPTPEFGSIGPDAFTGFEEAEDGAISFIRTAESTELGWTMIGGGAIASVVEDFVDPDDPANQHQFHLNNGSGNVMITTELIDLRDFVDVQVSLDLRTWDTSSGFEAANGINVSIFTSIDGLTFESLSWISLMGKDAATANQGTQHGAFTSYVTDLGLIPDDAATMKVMLTLNVNSASEHIMLDNLWITASPPGPMTLFWDGQGDGDWRDRDPVTEFSRWTDRHGNPGTDQPRIGFHAVVRTDTVTVTGDREASSLLVEGGEMFVAEDASLTLAESLTVRSEASIALDHNAGLTVGESLVLEGQMTFTPTTPTAPGEQAVAVTGEATLGQDSTLTFNVDGAHPFKAGTYTLLRADKLTGTIASSSGLGHYVILGAKLDGLTYTDTALTLSIARDLNPGDANLSGGTDVSDFNIWNTNKFTSGTDWRSGDFNGDGTTDVRDFNAWNTAKFTLAASPAPVSEGQVPEPTALLLLSMAVVGWIVCGRRRYRNTSE